MAANDVAWEGLITPIALVRLWERATSLVIDIGIHELEEMLAAITEFCVPVRVHVSLLTIKQCECP